MFRVEGLNWKVEGEGWRVEGGGWRAEGGGRRAEGRGFRVYDFTDTRRLLAASKVALPPPLAAPASAKTQDREKLGVADMQALALGFAVKVCSPRECWV